jgi:hypothetical protein
MPSKGILNAPFLVTIRSTEIQSDRCILSHMGCGTSVAFCRMMTRWELSKLQDYGISMMSYRASLTNLSLF